MTTVKAKHTSNCHYCGRRIYRGMPIGRASFKTHRDDFQRTCTEYVHAGEGAYDCVRHARGEWPELNS